MIDPRSSIIGRRTEEIGSILAFASGKGGVGKSACAAVAALQLASQGRRVGLFDMDFTGASAHLFLGTDLHFPEEERGIIPIEAGYGLRFMSAAAYTGERGFALRGGEVTDVFLELFAITRWNGLDYLILDMPPGLGDTVLDLIRYLPAMRAVLITTPSQVSRRVVGRMARVFREAEVPVCGCIENMRTGGGGIEGSPEQNELEGEIPLLARIPLSADLEAALGSPEALLNTGFARALQPAVLSLDSAAGEAR
jgi:ATP-binding protein involved in chromosome partitioning